MTTVAVLGLWHLGGVYASCFADLGNDVIGGDTNAEWVAGLNAGRPPLFEPGLPQLVARHLQSGRLRFTTDLPAAVRVAEYVQIAYDAPVDEQDRVDPSGILALAPMLAANLRDGATLVVSSQLPVGSCEALAAAIRGHGSRRFGIACVPENLQLGRGIERFMQSRFFVVGAEDEATAERTEALFAPVGATMLRMNVRSAEMTKHALNSYIATSISFANELANLCAEVGADVEEVVRALRLDRRVSPEAALDPGLGFAGGTLARDVRVLSGIGHDAGYEPYLVDAVLRVNERQNAMVVRRLAQVAGNLRGLMVGVLGLTYKAGTSSVRRSPALAVVEELIAAGASVRAHDPHVDRAELAQRLPACDLRDDVAAVAQGADALVVMTDWPEYAALDFTRLGPSMRHRLVLDPRRCLDRERVVAAGFTYVTLGSTAASTSA